MTDYWQAQGEREGRDGAVYAPRWHFTPEQRDNYRTGYKAGHDARTAARIAQGGWQS